MEPGAVRELFEREPLGIELILRLIEAQDEAETRSRAMWAGKSRTMLAGNSEPPQKYGIDWSHLNKIASLLPAADGSALPAEKLVKVSTAPWEKGKVLDFTEDHQTLAKLVNSNYPQRLEGSFPEGSVSKKLARELFQPYNNREDDVAIEDTATLAVIESLPLMPRGTRLPGVFDAMLRRALISGLLYDKDYETTAGIVKRAISDERAPLEAKRQILKAIGKEESPAALELMLHGYKAMGNAVAEALRGSIVNMMLSGLAEEEKFKAHRAELAGIYVEKDGLEAGKRLGLIRQAVAGTVELGGLETADRSFDFTGKGSEVSYLPLSALESYVADVNLLKQYKARFPYIKLNLTGSQNALVAPFEQLGIEAIAGLSLTEFSRQWFTFLKALHDEGKLEDRMLGDFLSSSMENFKGEDGAARSAEEIAAAANRNLRELLRYDFPIRLDIHHSIPLELPEAYFRDSMKSIDAVSRRDPGTAILLFRALRQIRDVFGSKAQAVVSYFEKDRNREQIRTVSDIKYDMCGLIEQLEMQSTSRTQMKKLVQTAIGLNMLATAHDAFGIDAKFENTNDANTIYERVEKALAETGKKLGFPADDMIRFLPWVKSKDQTAMKALRGEPVQKAGAAATYGIEADNFGSLDEMCNEVLGYANMVGADTHALPRPATIEALKELARYVMREVETRSRKKELGKDVVGEVKPNLDRILTLTGKTGAYSLAIEPENIKAQMDALQNISSCLSPGGSNFRYTQAYMQNPNISWATIKDSRGNVAGRVTLFYGEDQNGKQAIARASNVYSNAMISERAIDDALKSYAKEHGLVLVSRGPIKVPGIGDEVYDDYVSRSCGMAEGIVMVNTGKDRPSGNARAALQPAAS